MVGFEATASYKLIYIYAIWNESHQGLLKVGEASLSSSKTYKELTPDCADLNMAAKKRIDQQTQTSGTAYQLLYTELAVFEKVDGDGSVIPMPISNKADKKVHAVLKASGIKQVCPDGVAADEWFEVDLQTAKNAIKAMKEGRKSLTSGEILRDEPDIILRKEQLDAIEKTKLRFKKYDNMLWNAKMRYGKTVTALELVRQMKFRRVIIVTHRPVVGSGWQEDFYKIFKGEDAHYSFLFKDKSAAEEDFDLAIDSNNDVQLRNFDALNKYFVYFASIQDLRGSQRVGGKFDKNNVVFDMEWDLLIGDEAHEGTQTDLGKDVIEKLKKKKTKVLSLSGTPFNIIDQFDEDGVYTWDYVMEQYEKDHWDENHPGEPNPYQDLPKMHIYTYDLGDMIRGYDDFALEGKAFNFREFFRVWTGNQEVDGREMTSDTVIGDFIHANDVQSFLNLLTKEDEYNNYPYSTQQYRDMFKHTLWMLPGVKEAKALSTMLQKHPVFGNFAIANVAGSGDEETNYDDALAEVRSKIKSNEYTITLSCGKLTTGVTVKEWTAVFILSGSQNTSAAGYLQTIFRAQSPGSIGGRRKENCYVFDFAPDRSLRVFAEAAKSSKGIGGGGQDEVLKEFLNFCPIIAVNGTQMKHYDVTSMMGQIKKIQVERAIKNGFDDTSIYNDELMKLDKIDLREFDRLKEIVGSHQAQKQVNKVKINQQGFTDEEYKEVKRVQKKPPKELTEEEKRMLEKLREQRKQKKSAISILRAISIRMPLLIYGADVPFEQDITLEWFVDQVDKESWDEFMPQGVTKNIFRKFMKYYDKDVLITAGREIRRLAKEADKLSPTDRVRKIAVIFSYFKNPDKETVLTPWRVVNMHMSDCLGGWCFYDNQFREDTQVENFRLEQPRFVDRGKVTTDTLNNSKATILEINSKSGLYPLYVAYSLYRAKLGTIPEEDLTPQAQQKYWIEAVQNGVYVVCKTPMARAITQRTLTGYSGISINARYFKNLVEVLKTTPDKFQKKISQSSWWKKEGGNMRFDAIVGNPPYQSLTNGGTDSGNAAKQATPVFHSFVEQAKMLDPHYISMIIPARWYNGGMGLNDFRTSMLNDGRIETIIDYANSKELFPTVDIAGGICYFLWNSHYSQGCNVVNVLAGKRNSLQRDLNQFGEMFIRSNDAISIIEKITSKATEYVSDMVSAIDTFGIPSKEKGHEEYHDGDVVLLHSVGSNSQGTSFISKDKITKNIELIDKYKIKISIMVPQNGEVGISPEKGYRSISTPQILYPGTVDTFSYLNIGFFDTELEAVNFRNFMTCKLPRFMMRTTYSSVHISKNNFVFVPMMDFKQPWNDEKLYSYFELAKEEIELVESTMRPLVLQSDDIQSDYEGSSVKTVFANNWVRYYGDYSDELDFDFVGKWVCSFSGFDFAKDICKAAVRAKVVNACQHSNSENGEICFFINGEDLYEHRQLISWLLDHDLLYRNEAGILDNLTFTYDHRTSDRDSDLTLDQFVDLETGELLV